MSMREYPVWDAGILIDFESDEGRMMLNILAGTDDVKDALDVLGDDWDEVVERLPNAVHYRGGDENTLWFYPINPENGSMKFAEGTEIEGNFVVISLWDSMKFFGVPYQSLDELVDALKKLAGEYLPDDFDYTAHIGMVVGSYYG